MVYHTNSENEEPKAILFSSPGLEELRFVGEAKKRKEEYLERLARGSGTASRI